MAWKMKIYIWVLLIACLSLSEGRKRVKRNLIQLAEQIEDLTGRDALKFNGYGCYCGWGGSGKPVDETDHCCQNHDDCYGSVTTDLPDCSPKWNEYKWDIMGKTIDCLDQVSATKAGTMLFNDKSSQNCPRRICECDKALVECLYRNTYNPENFGVNKELKCKN